VCPFSDVRRSRGSFSFRSVARLIFSEKPKQEDVPPVSFPLKGKDAELDTAASTVARTMALNNTVPRIEIVGTGIIASNWTPELLAFVKLRTHQAEPPVQVE
jgi:hypothetical protein